MRESCSSGSVGGWVLIAAWRSYTGTNAETPETAKLSLNLDECPPIPKLLAAAAAALNLGGQLVKLLCGS